MYGKYGFMQRHQQEFRLTRMSAVLHVSRSGFYAWQRRGTSARTQANQRLIERMRSCISRRAKPMGRGRFGRRSGETGLRAVGIGSRDFDGWPGSWRYAESAVSARCRSVSTQRWRFPIVSTNSLPSRRRIARGPAISPYSMREPCCVGSL